MFRIKCRKEAFIADKMYVGNGFVPADWFFYHSKECTVTNFNTVLCGWELFFAIL